MSNCTIYGFGLIIVILNTANVNKPTVEYAVNLTHGLSLLISIIFFSLIGALVVLSAVENYFFIY